MISYEVTMKVTRYIPISLLTLFCLKSLIIMPNIESALCIAVLGAISFFFEYKLEKKEISDLEQKIKENKDLLNHKLKDVEEIKTAIATVKLAAGLRVQSVK